MEDSIFDRILRGEIPADIVYQDEDVVAFRDINPEAPVHVLVVPRKKFVSLVDAKNLEADVLGKFMIGISKAATALGLDADGYRVVFNNGKLAQQSVPYVHAHILSGRRLKWPPG